MKPILRSVTAVAALAAAVVLAGCERPPVDSVQRGYRGLAMGELSNPRTAAARLAANAVPAAPPAAPGGAPAASSVYKNVQVLGDLDLTAFTRLMASMTAWVAPNEGCVYCHNGADFADDAKYTKVVARRMIQMTRHVNADWSVHVADTGVTCYTCHRGRPVPEYVWTRDPGPKQAANAGNRAGQNAPGTQVGLTSLPYDPMSTFFDGSDTEIRVISTAALPGTSRVSIKQAEWTYALMMHMSQSLGVNCTYCHNSRTFFDWSASTPQRVTAWHGIRMVRDLNRAYLDPLAGTFPPERHGPLGDGPKLDCATCHQGAYKPLFGANMSRDFPELRGAAAH